MDCHGFRVGDAVKVVGGTHKGMRGSVVGATECFVKVSKEGKEGEVRVKKENVRAAAAADAAAGPAIPTPTGPLKGGAGGPTPVPQAPSQIPPTLACGQKVRVTRGTYVRLTGEIIAVTAKQYKIRTSTRCTETVESFRVPHSSVELDISGSAANTSDDDDHTAGNDDPNSLADVFKNMSIVQRPTLEEVGQGSADWARVKGKMLRRTRVFYFHSCA